MVWATDVSLIATRQGFMTSYLKKMTPRADESVKTAAKTTSRINEGPGAERRDKKMQ